MLLYYQKRFRGTKSREDIKNGSTQSTPAITSISDNLAGYKGVI